MEKGIGKSESRKIEREKNWVNWEKSIRSIEVRSQEWLGNNSVITIS